VVYNGGIKLEIKSKGGMALAEYQFGDTLYWKRGKSIAVINEAGEQTGYIQRAEIPECEKGHVFSFTTQGGEMVSMGIKKRGLKNLLFPQYIIQTGSKTYTLKDKPGANLLYFCVEGKIENAEIRIEENWGGDIEVKAAGEKLAVVKPGQFISKTLIRIDDELGKTSVLFFISILIHFMYKIYKDEADFIEDILLD
jgi:hypothetical protein